LKRLLLVEDSMLFRSALVNILRSRSAEVETWPSRQFATNAIPVPFDLTLLDAVTWSCGLSSLVRSTTDGVVDAPVLLLGTGEFLSMHPEILHDRIAGLVEQTATPATLWKAIRHVIDGGIWFDRPVFRALFSTSLNSLRSRMVLEPRQAEVLQYIVLGKTNKEIGAALGYSERTIKAYVAGLFSRTGVSTRSGLTAYAILNHLVDTGKMA